MNQVAPSPSTSPPAPPGAPWEESAEAVAAALATDPARGLSDAEAARLAEMGPNTLTVQRAEPWWWPWGSTSSSARRSSCSPSRSSG